MRPQPGNQPGSLEEPQTILGHPRGLFVLFFTEFWERFSFYGMQALLVFYLTQHFLFSDDAAIGLFGSYTSLVYATPVLGGILADRYLGFRKAVTLGAVLLVLGHFGMAFEGSPATQTVDAGGASQVVRDAWALRIFYLSLGLLIVGVGCLKANISTIVGQLYPQDDPRRDSGFTIFYMGINIGAALAALVCGYLGQKYGWRYGFGLAGIGMLFGLAVFTRGKRHLLGKAEPPDPVRLREPVVGGLSREWLIYLGTGFGVLVASQLVQQQQVVGALLGGFGAVMGGTVLYLSFFRCERIERDRMLVALTLMLFSILFWAFWGQAGSSMNLFADRNVDRMVGNIEIQASQFQATGATFIVLLTPLFSWMWVALARRGLEPSTPVKFGLGIVLLGLGFALLSSSSQFGGDDARVAMIWLLGAYFLHTTGELCVSPVGLSMVTKLSIPRVAGMMMGVWFLSTAAAYYVAAIIAKGASVETVGGIADPHASLHAYAGLYGYLAIGAIVVGLFLLALSPVLKRAMHGRH